MIECDDGDGRRKFVSLKTLPQLDDAPAVVVSSFCPLLEIEAFHRCYADTTPLCATQEKLSHA